MLAFGGSGLGLLGRDEAAGVLLNDFSDEPLGRDEEAWHGRGITGSLAVEWNARLPVFLLVRRTTPQIDDDTAFAIAELGVELCWRLHHRQRLQPVDGIIQQLRVVSDDARGQHACGLHSYHKSVVGLRQVGKKMVRAEPATVISHMLYLWARTAQSTACLPCLVCHAQSSQVFVVL